MGINDLSVKMQKLVVAKIEDVDDALLEIQSLPLESFDRYDNSFEQKYAIREKTNLPPAMEKLVVSLEKMAPQVAKMFGASLIDDYTRHYCGIFQYLKGDKLDVHVDAGIHPITKLRKHVTAVLYLGEGGGPLEFWDGQSCIYENPKLDSMLTSIEPSHGKLILFENNDYAWHGTPVYQEDTPRIVVTVSYLSRQIIQFGNRRERAFFVPRPDEIWTEEMYELRNTRADPARYKEAYKSMA